MRDFSFLSIVSSYFWGRPKGKSKEEEEGNKCEWAKERKFLTRKDMINVSFQLHLTLYRSIKNFAFYSDGALQIKRFFLFHTVFDCVQVYLTFLIEKNIMYLYMNAYIIYTSVLRLCVSLWDSPFCRL